MCVPPPSSLFIIRWGLKSYCLCESKTGYCYAMSPYCGERTRLDETVLFLLGDLKDKGHHLYMDNFYNSVSRAQLVMGLGTHCCGTIRRFRGEPEVIKKVSHVKHLKEGERIVRHNGEGVMSMVWRDKKLVRMVNTIHQDKMVTVEEKVKGSSKKVTYTRPECVVNYNKFMNGVDKMDQKISYYPFPRKTHRWNFKFIMYLFQLSFANALTVYKAKGGRQGMSLLDFILSVVEAWTALRAPGGGQPEVEVEGSDEEVGAVGGGEVTGGEEEEEEVVPVVIPAAPGYDPEVRKNCKLNGHDLRKFPVGRGGKLAPSKSCRWCFVQKGKRRETRYYCKECSYQPLCIECFFLYHK